MEKHGSMRDLDVRLANIAARRIVGLGRTARLAVLHAVAGAFRTSNTYNRQSALMLDGKSYSKQTSQ